MQQITGASQLLLNVCTIFIGSIIVRVFFPVVKTRLARNLLVPVILNAEMLLCMSFPYTELFGFSFDLRAIPMIIGPLYGGYLTSATMFTIYLLYRLVLGGPQTLTGIIVGSCLMAVAFLVSRARVSRSRTTTVLLASVPMVLLLTVLDFLIWHRLRGVDTVITTLILYDIVNLTVLWSTVLGIEYINENMRLREEVHRAEKLYVAGELAASIAHEIRNPMTVSRGFVQLTLASPQLPPTEQQYLETALNELDRAHDIIQDYLSLTQPQSPKIQRLPMEERVQRAIDLVAPYAHANQVSIRVEPAHDLYMYGDKQNIEQILINILRNAIEAMPDGGSVSVSSERYKTYARVHVADTGRGMTDAELKRIGTPFYSTKTKGTGLGLMTSYRMCEMMRGKIEVFSTPGKGTTVSIYLPLATNA